MTPRAVRTVAIVHPEIEAFDERHGGALARWTAEVARRAPPDVALRILTKPPRSSPYAGVRARLVPMRTAALERIPGARPYAIHWYTWELLHRVRRERADLLHVHARPQWVDPIRDAGFRGRLWLHLQNDHVGSWPREEKARLLSRCDRVLCCSEWLRRRTANLPTPDRPDPDPLAPSEASRVTTLHNGVDVARFRPPARPRGRDALATIAYVGRLVPEKAPHLTMEAVLRLRARGLGVRMLVVGAHDFGAYAGTPYVERLRALASHDPAGFRFTGYVHHRDLPTVLGRAGIYVHACTWQESFGLATAEAMACGLAPLVSRRGANLEVAGDEAVAFEPSEGGREVEAAIERLVADPALCADLGRRARARAVAMFSWDEVARRYFDLLRSA